MGETIMENTNTSYDTNNTINKHEKLPEELQHVLDRDENFQVLKNNTNDVKNFVKSKL